MGSKKQYYTLDEIGYVGTQERRSAAQVKKDAARTTEIIKALKSGKAKVVSMPAKSRVRSISAPK